VIATPHTSILAGSPAANGLPTVSQPQPFALERGFFADTMEPVTTPKLAPYLLVRDARGLAKFLEEGIGAKAGFQELTDDGKINHLELLVADSLVMIADAPSSRPSFPAMLHLYVPDADAAYRRAIEAGAESVREPSDASDGRRGGVRDRWGNEWWFTRRAK